MRILILSSRIELIGLLFEKNDNHYNICATIDQLKIAVSTFHPQIIIIEEEIFGNKCVSELKKVKSLIDSNIYLTCITRQISVFELSSRMFTNALLHTNDLKGEGKQLENFYINRQFYLSSGIRDRMECPLKLKKDLTFREKQILNLIEYKNSSNTISHLLNISTRTVENHRKSIKNKIGIRGGKNALINFTKLCIVKKQVLI